MLPLKKPSRCIQPVSESMPHSWWFEHSTEQPGRYPISMISVNLGCWCKATNASSIDSKLVTLWEDPQEGSSKSGGVRRSIWVVERTLNAPTLLVCYNVTMSRYA